MILIKTLYIKWLFHKGGFVYRKGKGYHIQDDKIVSAKSEWVKTTKEVPQRLVPVPLLFDIFVNGNGFIYVINKYAIV